MHLRQRLALACVSLLLIQRRRRKRTVWVKPWLGDYQRMKHSFCKTLEPIFREQDPPEFQKYARMSVETFDELLLKVSPLITKSNTRCRLSITPTEKLALTLAYLAEGVSMKRLSYEYRVGVSTVSEILEDTMSAIYTVLQLEYLVAPNTEEIWRRVASRFETEWNFPMCIGALDGKHIQMFAPRNSGRFYFNYKEAFSIVLLALVDADYKFLAIDVGANGRSCDAGIWDNSLMKKLILQDKLKIPGPQKIINSDIITPHVIVADSGFGLEKFLMRPYPERHISTPERIFNYRLSRARRVSENAFGILANRWRVLMKRLLISPEKATNVVLTCCALHNMLRTKADSKLIYVPNDLIDREDTMTGEVIPGTWRQFQLPGLQFSQRNHSFEAKSVRNVLKDYFNGDGKVMWQSKYSDRL